MTHEDLIAKLVNHLNWTESDVTRALHAMLAAMKAELAENNPVTIDDFGEFSTLKQSEYILKDRETNERYLMPPAVEVVFAPSTQHTDQVAESLELGFSPEEELNDSVNNSFTHFVPTLLKEGVSFPGIAEIVEEDFGDEEEIKEIVTAEPVNKVDVSYIPSTPYIREKRHLQPGRKKKKHKKTSALWIPIIGGVAIALAGLFFFRVWQPGKSDKFAAYQSDPDTEKVTKPSSDTTFSKVTDDSTGIDLFTPEKTERKDLSQEAVKIRLAAGQTLRLLALEQYGSREFWIYIYLENQSQIKNPNQVPVGTELRIPDTSRYHINANDPQSVMRAKEIGDRALNRL